MKELTKRPTSININDKPTRVVSYAPKDDDAILIGLEDRELLIKFDTGRRPHEEPIVGLDIKEGRTRVVYRSEMRIDHRERLYGGKPNPTQGKRIKTTPRYICKMTEMFQKQQRKRGAGGGPKRKHDHETIRRAVLDVKNRLKNNETLSLKRACGYACADKTLKLEIGDRTLEGYVRKSPWYASWRKKQHKKKKSTV